MKDLINEKTLIEKGFTLNMKHNSDTFKMYEKGDVIIESSFMSDGKWALRERTDGENSKYIGMVKTWHDVSVFNCA